MPLDNCLKFGCNFIREENSLQAYCNLTVVRRAFIIKTCLLLLNEISTSSGLLLTQPSYLDLGTLLVIRDTANLQFSSIVLSFLRNRTVKHQLELVTLHKVFLTLGKRPCAMMHSTNLSSIGMVTIPIFSYCQIIVSSKLYCRNI